MIQANFGFRVDRETRSAGTLTLQIPAIDHMLFMPLKCGELSNLSTDMGGSEKL